MVEERYFQNNYYDNLGMVYASGTGTFTIRGSNARSLSPSNPAVIFLPSKATPGAMTKYTITADQNFIDDNGSSQIIGNLFGTTTSVAWANAVPFYLYAVTNDDEDTIQFMISRVPHAKVSPAAASIGAPDDAVADTQGSFFSFDNIDETLYDSNPCMCVGSFRMVKSASDDWTVQTITRSSSIEDGIGSFNEDTVFTMPSSQNGAASGKFWKDNGGTAPGFLTNTYEYWMHRNGEVTFNYNSNNVNVAGVGAVSALLALPYVSATSPSGMNYEFASGYYADAASTFANQNQTITDGTSSLLLIVPDVKNTGFMNNEDFDSTDGSTGSVTYLTSLS